MVEVLWVGILGAALAWLHAMADDASVAAGQESLDDEWARWEAEIHDWREP